VLRVLGNLLQLPGFDYQSSEQVRDELRAALEAAPARAQAGPFAPAGSPAAEVLVDVPMYQVDALLRRSPSLQATRIALAGASEYRP
jgi:NADH-quinone oxidoreductase subunit G